MTDPLSKSRDGQGGAPRPRVVIVGGGFGGLNAARALRRAPVDITLVDRTNHHLFQPLLYQVAMATLAPSDIAVPIRWVLRRQANATVLMADVTAVDPARRVVTLDDGREELAYDYLVLAVGARHAYFGHDDWEPLAPGLKSLDDAMDMRQRFLLSFELAEKEDDPAERAALQTFVIVGAGPTGVELAGILPEIARRSIRRDFRRIDTARSRVILVEGGPRVLPTFPESISRRAQADLEGLGVELRLNTMVTGIEPGSVTVGGGERIAARTVYWAAGNAASPLGRMLGAPVDRAGRVLVEPDLSVAGHPEVFVVGDLAAIVQDGRPVPGVAPAAMQEGRQAADNILRTLRGEHRRPFRYLNKGDLATIGRHKAVADFGRFRVTGRTAWWLWLFVHIMYLVGFRNRVSVLVQWAWAYIAFQRGVRLIHGPLRTTPPPARDAPAPADEQVLAPKW